MIALAGREVFVPRARLGLHLRLGRIAAEFRDAPGWAEMATALRAYFAAAGVDIAGASPVELLAAFAILERVNRWQWALAFMAEPGDPDAQMPAYDYLGRNWTWVIHKLASRYGWTVDYIFGLWPEEAACYLQEILVSEIVEAEERHSLSELSYRYDSASKISRYIPLPKPGWMVPRMDAKPVRILRSMLPYGPIVDLETGQTIQYN